jgi:hypothetical protein
VIDETEALRPAVGAAVQELREILRIDGADISLRAVTTSTLEFELELSAVPCLECVMPRDVLEEILLSRLNEVDPNIVSVAIGDPREDG